MRQNFPALLGAAPYAFAAASVLARRRWSFAAGACVVAAAALLLLRRADAAFVAATLGVVAWFWDKRNHHRSLIIQRDETNAESVDDFAGDEADLADEVDELEDDDTTN